MSRTIPTEASTLAPGSVQTWLGMLLPAGLDFAVIEAPDRYGCGLLPLLATRRDDFDAVMAVCDGRLLFLVTPDTASAVVDTLTLFGLDGVGFRDADQVTGHDALWLLPPPPGTVRLPAAACVVALLADAALTRTQPAAA